MVRSTWRAARPSSSRAIIKDVLTVDALSTILLLTSIEAVYPNLRLIHVFLDNARYHHAKLVRAWLARPDCRVKLHFVPAYCPHLNPIERLWGLMVTGAEGWATADGRRRGARSGDRGLGVAATNRIGVIAGLPRKRGSRFCGVHDRGATRC